MKFRNTSRALFRATLLGGGALITAATATQAFGQTAQDRGSTLEEIVVTAQKREQSLQDVPIAVTAITQETLQVNRIANISDLSSLAPNFTVLTTAGGAGIPTVGMRGLVSAGSVAGQDRSVGIYLDGVAIGSALGSTFDLPDLERIEVLRGPQGTLFGRNSTGGAISVITRAPSGKFGLRQELTYGNYEQFRSVTRLETPTWGPLSASISYTHNERDGDVKNGSAGFVWDRSAATGRGLPGSARRAAAVKTMGAKNEEAVFVAVKFQPSDNFTTLYKFDWMENDFTPGTVAAMAFTPEAGLGAAFGGLVRSIYNANPTPLASSGKRPKYAYDRFSIPGYQKVWGHNITSTLQVNDSLSIKNILAYRGSYIFAASDLSGLGTLVNTVPTLGPVGAPYHVIGSQVYNRIRQWSEELQLNYNSERLTLTAGAIYYDLKSLEGSPDGLQRVPTFQVFGGGVLPRRPLDLNVNRAKSYAAYAQAEVHVTPQLDVIGGYRLTKDDKTGINFVAGNAFPFTYSKTRPSYLAGVNYKPTEGLLLYGKYATGFVAGGTTSTIVFQPETVKSWEGGVKADLLDRRLRLNVAAFTAKYNDLQAVGAGTNIGRAELGTIVLTQGDLKTKGFEAEVTAAPTRGLTLNGSLGYTDWTLSNLNTTLLGPPQFYRLNYRTHWTSTVSAQYESEPLFGEARLLARVDGNWRAKMRVFSRLNRPPEITAFAFSPAGWIVNGRLALRDIKLSRGDLEIAAWGRNVFDNKRSEFPLDLSFEAVGTYTAARTFGVDVIYNY